jgi:hypothetical protein
MHHTGDSPEDSLPEGPEEAVRGLAHRKEIQWAKYLSGILDSTKDRLLGI